MDDAPITNGNGRTAGPISEAMTHFFAEEKWSYMPWKASPAIRFRHQRPVAVMPRPRARQFVFYSVCPASAPDRARHGRIRHPPTTALIIGNLKWTTATANCATRPPRHRGRELSPTLLRSLVYAGVTMMDHYLPGIMAVLYGNVSPESIDKLRAE
jgi:hypothetical protein